ncbi:MAG TPA: shikimate kinase [Bacteroidales bacterium]|nr:MAG: Shikimate kinase [Bacteroidetes bacterium ADurb.Bin139]HOG24733.1 shikimate kinase [Bacteroidales bacterium]HOR12165.1 shikimate kinase [Bacteroidales bacterium]HOZ19118.1 shikimate kinase [Bacteroidales bacterium]HPK39688.1 shikimate kinase [Bacteroidales bacterium]
MGLIFYIGFMASGKSTLGAADATRKGMRFVDLDRELWALSGMPSWQYITEKGEEAFRLAERDTLHRIVERWHQEGEPLQIVACGGGTPCFFDNMEFMKTSGHVVFIDTPLSTILERISRDPLRWPLAKCGNIEILYLSRKKWYDKAHDRIVP